MSRVPSYLVAMVAAFILAFTAVTAPVLAPAAVAGPVAPAKTSKALSSSKPTISGDRAAGSTLTAKPGTWTKATKFSYQWYVDGLAIKAGTKKTLKLSSSRVGKKITVKVTGKKSGHTTTSRTSSATAKIATVAKPKITGSAKVATTLTVKPGAWTKGTTFTYQWYAGGKAVKGATKKTLKLSTSHVGKKITVKVTGKAKGYGTVSRTSSASTATSYPTRTAPSSASSCPSWAPIKGNGQSMIYHLPHNQSYKVTLPEDCFRTEAAAKKAGYRAAKR